MKDANETFATNQEKKIKNEITSDPRQLEMCSSPIADATKDISHLESGLLDALSQISYFKDPSLLPCVILKYDDAGILLGMRPGLISKVRSNYTLSSCINSAVHSVFKDSTLRVEFCAAEHECNEYLKKISSKQEETKKIKEEAEDRQEQIDAGRCSIVPFPKSVAEDLTVSDASLPGLSLFTANTCKDTFRVVEKQVVNPKTKEKTYLKISIGNKNHPGYGVLRQSHQQAFYKLLQEWGHRGHPLVEVEGQHLGVLKLSMYELAKIIGRTGGRGFNQVNLLMEEMSAIRVKVVESQQNGTKWTNSFSLISFERREKEAIKETKFSSDRRESVRIIISGYVVDNFLRKNIRPVSLKSYMSLEDHNRTGLVRLVFDWLEFVLSNHSRYSKRLEEFPAAFGTSKYQHKSKRKEKIKATVGQLNGQSILDGRYTAEVWLEETSDGTDFKMVARRMPVNL